MAGLGNPLSFELGGGPSPQEQVYQEMKQSVGTGNSADGLENETIIESWRWARARALAAMVADDRAAVQAFPDIATDFIPVYEQILNTFFDEDTPDSVKQSTLAQVWTLFVTAVQPEIEARLQEIDPSITVTIPNRDLLRETQVERAFEDYDPTNTLADGPPFNLTSASSGPKCTSIPNYSDDFKWLVSFPVGAAITTNENRIKLKSIENLLNESIPAWCGFTIFTDSGGFQLDVDLLDVTIFGTP